METIDQIIGLKNKSIDLLEELKQAIEYEECDISIDQIQDRWIHGRDWFVAFDKTGKELFDGTLLRCESKAKLRKLKYLIRDLKGKTIQSHAA